jgi:4-hydroxy-2-oxoglutarate aldolase
MSLAQDSVPVDRLSPQQRASVPKAGCYVPAITFYDPKTDRIQFEAQAKYYAYLASTHLTGLVILGTNAETFMMTREERKALLLLARRSVPQGFPIIAGVSGHSTAQVLEYIEDAYNAGADYALVLPAAYFGKQTTPDVVRRFYKEVALASPLPIIIYNFPAVCNGLDLDSEIITQIVRDSVNVVGVKLTCGSVAKITRLAATFPPSRFAVFGGQSDFMVGGLASGSSGCIAVFANVFPESVANIYKFWTSGQHEQALALQKTLALAESPTKAGIANTKYAAAIFSAPRAGIADAVSLLGPRRPYEPPNESAKESIRKAMEELNQEEKRLVLQSKARL